MVLFEHQFCVKRCVQIGQRFHFGLAVGLNSKKREVGINEIWVLLKYWSWIFTFCVNGLRHAKGLDQEDLDQETLVSL